MTEDLDETPRHGQSREPSSAALDIAKLRERHIALKADVGDMRDTVGDIKSLLISYIQTSDTRHAQLLATFNQHNLEDAVVHTSVRQIDEHLRNTDKNVAALVEAIDSDKRSPVALILGVLSGIGTAATAIWVGIKGG